jgi:hypothetical protein
MMSFTMAWEILWALILGFWLPAVIQAVVPKEEMSRLSDNCSSVHIWRYQGDALIDFCQRFPRSCERLVGDPEVGIWPKSRLIGHVARHSSRKTGISVNSTNALPCFDFFGCDCGHLGRSVDLVA